MDAASPPDPLVKSIPSSGDSERREDFALFRNGREIYPRMLEDIRSARESVLLEMYIFRDDRTGAAFAEALSDAARRGIEVRVLYDALGCHDVPRGFFDTLAGAGVKVREYNPLRLFGKGPLFRRHPLLRRDHRKLLVIDKAVCTVGGINIGDEFLDWEDAAIRLSGPIAREAARSFYLAWDARFLRPLRSLLNIRKKPPALLALCESAPLEGFSPVKRIYLAGIKRAAVDVRIAHAYFFPSLRMRKLLVRLARKGVRVRIVVPAHSDVMAQWYAGCRFYTYFLKRGVRLFQYGPSMLHAKYAVVDDHWATLGSANLNPTSFYLALELNVLVRDRAIIQALEDNFERTVRESRELSLAEWHKRPRYRKFLELFFYYAFRYFFVPK